MVSTSGSSGTARHVTVLAVTEPQADADLVEVFDEVLAAAGEIMTLPDAARVEVWLSAVLAIWREPGFGVDPAVGDTAFGAYLAERSTEPAAAALTSALGAFAPSAGRAWTAPGEVPPWHEHVGTAVAVGAARIGAAGLGEALVLEFVHTDGHAHCLMADVDDAGLASLTFGPALAELIAADEDGRLRVSTASVAEIAAAIEAAWRRSLAAGRVMGDDYLMNHLLAERRLRSLLGEGTRSLATVPADEWEDPYPPEERAAANATAARTLRVALRLDPSPEAPSVALDGGAALVQALVDPAALRGRPRSEREALRVLEWADWLGVAIGLARGGEGTAVDGHTLVDLVNRCPEVTSAIPKGERDYYEWAFGVVAAALTEGGLVVDGRAAPDAPAAVVSGVLAAWEQDQDAGGAVSRRPTR
jgi:hypothetical protein